MAKDILKEAIADAKAVREVALANAKAALEEAFTPKLQSMLSAKLSEELNEEEDMEEMNYGNMEEDEMEETVGMEKEGKDDLDEELNLLRAKLKNGIETTALPESEKLSSEENNEIELVDVSELDNDLEELKRNIE